MFCVKCGTQISDDSRFCPKCGANIGMGVNAAGGQIVQNTGSGMNLGVIIAISAGAILLVGGIVLGAVLLTRKPEEKQQTQITSNVTEQVENSGKSEPVEKIDSKVNESANEQVAEESKAEKKRESEVVTDVHDETESEEEAESPQTTRQESIKSNSPGEEVLQKYSDYYYANIFGGDTYMCAFVFVDKDEIPECIVDDGQGRQELLIYNGGNVIEISEDVVGTSVKYVPQTGKFILTSGGYGSTESVHFYHMDNTGHIVDDGYVWKSSLSEGEEEYYVNDENVDQGSYYAFKNKFGGDYIGLTSDQMEFYMNDAWKKAVD